MKHLTTEEKVCLLFAAIVFGVYAISIMHAEEVYSFFSGG